MTLVKYWVDMHGNFLRQDPGAEAKPKAVYLAADVDALLDDPQALAAYLIERQKRTAMSDPIYCEGDCQEVLTPHGRRVQLCGAHATLWEELRRVSQQLKEVLVSTDWKMANISATLIQVDQERCELIQQLATVTQERDAAYEQQDDYADARNEVLTITKQLATARQEVWGAAANLIDNYNDHPGHFDPYLQNIVDWMHGQAKKAQP